MVLPDFLQFEPFNQLRQKMGAETLGHFEFFDPELHLTVDERKALEGGIAVATEDVRILNDHTLAYKNSRVVAYTKDPGSGLAWLYHCADCEGFTELITASTSIMLSTQQPRSDMAIHKVCSECLQRLRFEGFDSMRNRHRQYSQRLQDEFSLDIFFAKFPRYPLTENKQTSIV